jgi:hypothetical protein
LACLHAARSHADHAISISYRVGRIGDQVHHNLPKLRGIGLDGWKALAEIRFQHGMFGHRNLEQLKHLLDDLRNVDQSYNRILFTGIDHQLADDFGAADRYLPDQPELLFGIHSGGKLR